MELSAEIGRPGGAWETEVAVVLLGAAAMVAAGLAVLGSAGRGAPGPRSRGLVRLARVRLDLARASQAGVAGLALTTPLLGLLWRLGLPAAAPVVLGSAAAMAGGAILLRSVSGRWREAPPALAAPSPLPAGPFGWLAWLPAAAAVAALLWKLASVPLWSWDHYAIWGVKARRLFPEGRFDPAWAMPDQVSRPDYPLGLPLLWRTLSLGAEPGPAAFAAVHALMAVALVALVGWVALRLSGSRMAGGAAAALTAASPLLWDTESLGLADLPLALWAVAAVAVVTAHAAAGELGATARAGTLRRPAPPPLWVAGLCLGFLPWLKTEGLPLALGLLAASAVALHLVRPASGGRGACSHDPEAGEVASPPAAPGLLTGFERGFRARSELLRLAAALVLPAVVLGAAGLAATPAAGDRELGFFRGDWAARGLDRLAEAPSLAWTLAGDLGGGDWLGTWWLFGVATLGAAVPLLRRRLEPPARAAAATALALAAAVALQLALYLVTYLVSYIPAAQHAATSFHRVSAALAPLALLASAAAVGALGASGGGSSAPGRRR